MSTLENLNRKTSLGDVSISKAQKNASNSKQLNTKWYRFFHIKEYDMPLTLEEQLEKKEIRISSDQKVPYNINRHVLLTIYSLLIVLTNRLFFGWPNLSNLLFREKIYVWKCKKSADGSYIHEDPGKRFVCSAQDLAIQNIFTVGSSAYYAFSFMNGLIVDYLGSRVSMLLGHTLNFIGWSLLLFSNENFDGFVWGGVFIAASIDLASFSTLNISGLYPSSENLIVNIISGAGSLSTGTMLLLDLIITYLDLDTKKFMIWYISSSIGIFFILTIFVFPRTRFFRQYEFDNYYRCKELELANSKQEEGMTTIETSVKGETTSKELMCVNVKVVNDQKIYDSCDAEDASKCHYNLDVEEFDKRGKQINQSNIDISENNIISAEAPVKKKKSMIEPTAFFDVCKICISYHFIGLWIYGPLNAIYSNFYISAVENLLSTAQNDLLGYLLPFSVIPCVILGNITDKYGIMLMFFYEIFFAFAMYIFSLLNGTFWKQLSVISNTLYSACANGQLWTFISFTFSSKYHSTLIGLLNLVSGVISLSRIALLEWGKKLKSFTNIKILMISFVGINFLICFYFIFIKRRFGEKVTIGDKEK